MGKDARAGEASRYLVVGLGNPGPKYAATRHNAGFRAIDALARRHGIDLKGPRFWQRNLAEAGKGRIAGAEAILVKPQTFYNASGRAVQHFMARERIRPENVIVVYDDLDLPEGRLRLRPEGSHGGNNGLKSIIDAIGRTDFGRVRVGIGRPLHHGVPSWDPDVVMRYVLSAPEGESKARLEEAIERACDAVEAVIRDGWERAMDVHNRSQGPGGGFGGPDTK
ncbi:MAG TPA: aminoacyl-tRNA hydrolase [Dehalococcoidia bacterium]|nr:aminoacyl-tRNA hydrolase [Dehalococcoidia bacterium]